MAEDRFMEMFKQVMFEQIETLQKKGISEKRIIEMLRSGIIEEVLNEGKEVMSKGMVDDLEATMYERVLETRAHKAEFMARHEQIWGKGFIASEAMYEIVLEMVGDYNHYLIDLDEVETQDKKYRYVVLREIHARACQQFLEIIYLMKAGFADGAYARWRSMYELSVVVEFIKSNEEKVAKSYLEFADSEDKWYNWAKVASCFEERKGNIRFNDIQQKCDLSSENWKKQYELANKVVHASPQGTFKRLGNYKTLGVVPCGHSDYGIAIAAEHSAISLALITVQYLTLFPYGDSIVHADCINKWVDVVRKHYYEAERNCFSDENKLRAARIDGSYIEIEEANTRDE